jgi:hypothetical protein
MIRHALYFGEFAGSVAAMGFVVKKGSKGRATSGVAPSLYP